MQFVPRLQEGLIQIVREDGPRDSLDVRPRNRINRLFFILLNIYHANLEQPSHLVEANEILHLSWRCRLDVAEDLVVFDGVELAGVEGAVKDAEAGGGAEGENIAVAEDKLV